MDKSCPEIASSSSSLLRTMMSLHTCITRETDKALWIHSLTTVCQRVGEELVEV